MKKIFQGPHFLAGLSSLVLALTVLGTIFPPGVGGYSLPGDSAPGELVDADGHKLHLYCTGESSPTVILENGLGGTTHDWRKVQPEISRFTRVCSYDRAGMGWSEVGPMPRTSQRFVKELRTLLRNANIAGPYVLAGHSLGGVYVRHFARLYPNEVAALVLVDGSHEDQNNRFPGSQERREARGKKLLSQTEAAPEESTDPQKPPKRFFLALRSESLSFPTLTAEEIMAAPPLPPLPMPVLVANPEDRPPENQEIWLELQNDIASRSSRSKLILVDGAGHYIQLDKPQRVINSIRAMVEKARQ